MVTEEVLFRWPACDPSSVHTVEAPKLAENSYAMSLIVIEVTVPVNVRETVCEPVAVTGDPSQSSQVQTVPKVS
jgi:hypothetical protein